jgi:hypothetical protein
VTVDFGSMGLERELGWRWEIQESIPVRERHSLKSEDVCAEVESTSSAEGLIAVVWHSVLGRIRVGAQMVTGRWRTDQVYWSHGGNGWRMQRRRGDPGRSRLMSHHHLVDRLGRVGREVGPECSKQRSMCRMGDACTETSASPRPH